MSEAPDMSLILLLVLGILFSQPTLLPAILLFLVMGVAPATMQPAAVSVRPEAISCDSGDNACAMLQADRAAGPETSQTAEPGTP